MFRNGSFEGGWYHPDGVSELQIPNDWLFEFYTIDNPINSDNDSIFRRPEVRVFPKNLLPEHEQDLFVLDGEHCLKVFGDHKAWYGSFTQPVDDLEYGVYELSIPVYADLVDHYDGNIKVPAPDPLSGRIRFIINEEPSEWRNMSPLVYTDHKYIFQAGGSITITIEFMCPFALHNAGLFADKWTLKYISPIQNECPGTPREQYTRKYVLMHPKANVLWTKAAISGSWDRRWTVGGSADDAGMGDLENKVVIAINPATWGDDLKDFFKVYYPNVEYRAITAKTPEELERKLKDEEYDIGIGTPTSPATLISYHQQSPIEGTLDILSRMVEAGKPMKWYKIVHANMEFASEVKKVSPTTKILFRHVDNNWKYYQDGMRVNEFIDHFWDGVTRNEIDAVESLNETIATHDIEYIKKTVEFDTAFAKEIHRRSGGEISPVILTAPPGNPDHGAEVEFLIPAVVASLNYNGYLGPHTYWPGNPNKTTMSRWFEEEGYHYHMRPLLSWDSTFSKFHLKPKYLLGETGPVTVFVRADGRPGGFTDAGSGWVHPTCLNNDLDWLIKLMIRYEGMIAAWNVKNENRCETFSFFTSGYGVGWKWFLFNSYEWNRLTSRMYPL